ncbi:MAG: NAD kinase, partial [Bacilli bacterium]
MTTTDRRNMYLHYKPTTENEQKREVMQEIAEKYGYRAVASAEEANIIVSLGGDGDFLQAVRQTGFRQDVLYAGVSTDEELRFYCDFTTSQLTDMEEALAANAVKVRRYPTIELTIDGHTTFHCLNECSIRSSLIKTLVVDVWIDDLYFERFRGDGIVIATPSGSTAYNKSLGGAIVDPLIAALQVSEIASLNNNRYRTLGSSFILGEDRTLTLKVVNEGNGFPIIGIDNEALSAREIETIQLKISNKKIKTVKLEHNSFWHKVQR